MSLIQSNLLGCVQPQVTHRVGWCHLLEYSLQKQPNRVVLAGISESLPLAHWTPFLNSEGITFLKYKALVVVLWILIFLHWPIPLTFVLLLVKILGLKHISMISIYFGRHTWCTRNSRRKVLLYCSSPFGMLSQLREVKVITNATWCSQCWIWWLS